MLNFSKINIILIYLIFFVISFFSILNFQDKNNPYIDKRVNLGLDLQGGSYLLLEIDNGPVVTEILQNKVLELKKFFKDLFPLLIFSEYFSLYQPLLGYGKNIINGPIEN